MDNSQLKGGFGGYPATLSKRYEPRRRLGQGGMSTVWLAFSVEQKSFVAIKVASAELAQSPDFSSRFSLEAEIAKCKHHEALVEVYETGVIDGLPYIVMEALKGNSLRELIDEGKVSEELTARVGKTVASCLAALHAKGIVHRDIKPGNVFVENNGNVRLLDLGIARALDAEGPTKTGTILGSIWYLAPEYVCGAPVSPAIDIYSLGITLAEAYANKPIFRQWENKQLEFLGQRAKGKSCVDLSATQFKGKRALISQLIQAAQSRPQNGEEALKLLESKNVSALPVVETPKSPASARSYLAILALPIVCLIIALHHHFATTSPPLKKTSEVKLITTEYKNTLSSYAKTPKRKVLLKLLDMQRDLDKLSCAKAIIDVSSKFRHRNEFDDEKESGLLKHIERVLGLLELAAFLHLDRKLSPNDDVFVTLHDLYLQFVISIHDYEARLNFMRQQSQLREGVSYLKLAQNSLRDFVKPHTLDLAKRMDTVCRRAGKVSLQPLFELVAMRAFAMALKVDDAKRYMNMVQKRLGASEEQIEPYGVYWQTAFLREQARFFFLSEEDIELAKLSQHTFALEKQLVVPAKYKEKIETFLTDIQLCFLRLARRKAQRLEMSDQAFLTKCRKVRGQMLPRRRKHVDRWLSRQTGFEDSKL